MLCYSVDGNKAHGPAQEGQTDLTKEADGETKDAEENNGDKKIVEFQVDDGKYLRAYLRSISTDFNRYLSNTANECMEVLRFILCFFY